VISSDILLYEYISMGGHIIPAAEKASVSVTDAVARPLSISYAFLFPLHFKTFLAFGQK
jgi:hypothetical protein